MTRTKWRCALCPRRGVEESWRLASDALTGHVALLHPFPAPVAGSLATELEQLEDDEEVSGQAPVAV